MDPDLAGIFMFVLAGLFLIFAFAYVFNGREQKHKERKLELQLEIERAKAAQAGKAGADHTLIEDRLRVLERIVTDPSADLSRQIEDLRELKMDREKVQ